LGDLLYHFEDMFCDDNSDNDSEAENNADENLIEDVDLDCDISEEELRAAISSHIIINNNNSPGDDNLIAEIFKSGYALFSPFLLKLYNNTWKHMGLIIFGKNSFTCVSHLNLLNNVLPICICNNGTLRLTTHHVYKVTVSSNITITLKYIYLVSKNLNIELH